MQQIFVGDVQGCADELDDLLARARARFGSRFTLWLVGDLVNRGPHSLQVLRTVRELAEMGRARCVLGNHEVALLRTALGARELAPTDSFVDVLDAPDVDDWIDWLRSWPVAQIGRLGRQPFAMVHAAVHPDWSLRELEEQAAAIASRLAGAREAARDFLARDDAGRTCDAFGRLTLCRSVAGRRWSAQPPQRSGAVAWHAVWSQRGHDYGLVYGHWSVQGLHVAPLLRGLDTGCVHHGRDGDRALTAWLPDPAEEAPFSVPDESFWRIPARRVYYARRASPMRRGSA